MKCQGIGRGEKKCPPVKDRMQLKRGGFRIKRGGDNEKGSWMDTQSLLVTDGGGGQRGLDLGNRQGNNRGKEKNESLVASACSRKREGKKGRHMKEPNEGRGSRKSGEIQETRGAAQIPSMRSKVVIKCLYGG